MSDEKDDEFQKGRYNEIRSNFGRKLNL